jgi:hypothetical protein
VAAPWGSLLFENQSALMQSVDEEMPSGSTEASAENSLLSYCVVENGLGIIMEGTGARIEDSTIRQNYGSGVKIHNAGVTITRCRITDNISPTNGGGIYTSGSKLVHIDSNQVLNNYAEENGGGIFAYGEQTNTAADIFGNHIEGNHAQLDGGGVWASRSSLVNNQIFSNESIGKGGGVYSTFALVEDNHVATNEASQGGGIFTETNSSFTRNKIEKNTVTESLGGGVFINFCGVNDQNEMFSRNSVIENHASGNVAVGGIYINGALNFVENNLFKNNGFQLFNANSVDMEPFKAQNCYWGTKSKDEIEKLIFDNHENPDLSLVDFEPFAQEMINIDNANNAHRGARN